MSAEPGRTLPADALMEQARRAFETRDAALMRRLLESHTEVRDLLNAPVFPFGAPALVACASDPGTAMVDVLLSFGADPNRRSSWWAGGFHALHSASPAVAARLLAAGAVPDACAAAHLDRLDLLEELLESDPERVHERGGDGQTPLHFARSRAVVDTLLAAGADPDARDVDHRSSAAQWMLDRQRGAGRYELARYLVERGATADIFLAAALGLTERVNALLNDDASLLDLRTSQGVYGEQPPSSFHIYTWTLGANLSPLRVAMQFGHAETQGVMQRFASPRQQLVLACEGGDAVEARRLLSKHPRLMKMLEPSDHEALANAGWAPNLSAVELMLALGFDVHAIGQAGGTVLHSAAWNGADALVASILRHPPARELIAVRDPRYGSTPLGWCCHGSAHCSDWQADHAAVARRLLEAGAEPDVDLDDARVEVREAILTWRNQSR